MKNEQLMWSDVQSIMQLISMGRETSFRMSTLGLNLQNHENRDPNLRPNFFGKFLNCQFQTFKKCLTALNGEMIS
jgi:hypothetical protein